jgi:cation diffusion facilitator family transporter
MKPNCNTIKPPPQSQQSEKATLVVVIITLLTMFAEIIAGIISGSMALLSDGIHMGTHAVALFITLAAYVFARKHMNNPKYSFGTGKVGVLGGYTNAILLLIAGGAMAVESIERIINPINILFNQAIIVAVIGLIVNIASAFILGSGSSGKSHNHHEHSRSQTHDHHHDHNLKAAYLHVITDAMTSVLAIFALFTAKYFGYTWADPVVGIIGAIVIAKWAIGLLKQTSSVLLDRGDYSDEIELIRSKIESHSTSVQDLHLWQISENERSLILSLKSTVGNPPEYYHELVKTIGKYEHITVEINKKIEERKLK